MLGAGHFRSVCGTFTGGRGIIIDCRIRAQKGFLTAGYTRSTFPAWGLDGGREGSGNIVQFLPARGEARDYAFVSGLPTTTDDLIRVVTCNGGGMGNPRDRDPARVAEDVKSGYLTAEHARAVYGHAGR